MEKEKFMSRFKVGKSNPDQIVADQVYQGLHKKLHFGRIMHIIKTHGRDFVYRTWNEIRQGDCKDPLALFLYKVKNNKITWQQN